jgi:Ca2+-binding EF-hand superfamily protein
MFLALEKNHGITPEAAFGIYDMSDSGFCTQTEFKRITKIFFGEAVPEGPKLDFVMKLTVATVDGKIRYREFTKFLGKRFVKTFKQAASADDNQEEDSMR